MSYGFHVGHILDADSPWIRLGHALDISHKLWPYPLKSTIKSWPTYLWHTYNLSEQYLRM